MLDLVMKWGNQEKGVRALLLVGSRINGKDMDDLSDYDISVFGEGFDFIGRDDWLNQFGSPIVCIHEKFYWDAIQLPTRLTIFENWRKIDFAFHPLSLLRQMVDEQQLKPTYDYGYEVLLDKEGLTAHLPESQSKAYRMSKPDKERFAIAQQEFWFEAWHVAKYLCRKDPWVAKFRDDSMKKWLLLMLEWNAAAATNFSISFKTDGKQISRWTHPKYKKQLSNCFSGFDFPDRWKAFHATMDLFREVGKDTAPVLGYEWMDKLDASMVTEINKLIFKQDEQTKTQGK